MNNVGWWTITNFICFMFAVAFGLAPSLAPWMMPFAAFNVGALSVSLINLKRKGSCA